MNPTSRQPIRAFMKDIYILSCKDALSHQPRHEDAVIIRIFDQSGDIPPLMGSYNDELVLRFDDYTPSTSNPVHVLFNKAHAKLVIDFFKEHRRTKEIVFHCTAGISRSAALAVMFTRFIGQENMEKPIWDDLFFDPNHHVIQVMEQEMTKQGLLKNRIYAKEGLKRIHDYFTLMQEISNTEVVKSLSCELRPFCTPFIENQTSTPVRILYKEILKRIRLLENDELDGWLEDEVIEKEDKVKAVSFLRFSLSLVEELFFPPRETIGKPV